MDRKNKSKKWRKLASWFLIAAMLLSMAGIAGCGKAEGDKGPEEGKAVVGEPESLEETGTKEEAGDEGEEKVMGRYLEYPNEALKGELDTGSVIVRMDDGNLAIMSGNAGKWVSADGGDTWEKEKMPWHDEMKADGIWIMNTSMSKDGHIAVIYAGGESEEEQGEEQEEEDAYTFRPKYGIAAPDGTFTQMEIPYQKSEYVHAFGFAGDGRLFGASLGGKVYEIDKETGGTTEVAELPATAYYITESDNKLLLVHGDGVAIVDLENGEMVKDEVLDDFIAEQIGAHVEYASEGIQPLLLLADEDGILYLAFDKGIYRHVIGGNVMEQVMDGSLTSLISPNYGMTDGIVLDNDEFLIVFSGGMLMRYCYDPDTPAVPDVKLKAYSLRENQQLKTVIAAFQAAHPEAYVEYEIGMGENSAITREDALKKLNTEIAAGKGPDFLLLDGMPVDSYVEKGVLADLTPYLENKTEEEYFTNVLHAFRQEEGLYAVPAQFRLALIAGKKEDVEKISDLEALAGMVEAYREENPEGPILGGRSEEETLNILMPVCAPAWKGEDGKTDKEMLTQFYTLAKRIWDAESIGISEEAREEYVKWVEDIRTSGISKDDMREAQASVSNKMLGFMSGENLLQAGILMYDSGLDMVTSVIKEMGEENHTFAAYNGQAQSVFVPGSLMGINQTSKNQDMAVQLLEEMLDNHSWEGMPVNRIQWNESMRSNETEDGSAYASMGGSASDGSNRYHLDLYQSSEEDIKRLEQIVEEASVPYIRETVLEDAVAEAGVKVLCGEISPSAGAEEVMQKTAIFMAE